jgi:ketosteroid isomerase-like protein
VSAGSPASDLDELRALGQRYSRAVDARDLDALAAVFHPDAIVEGSRGSQSIAEWLDTMRAPRAFPTSMHVLGEALVTLDRDAGRAQLDTYAVVYQLGDKDAGQADLTLGIRYLDDAVRHEGRWVLRHRVAQTLWMR